MTKEQILAEFDKEFPSPDGRDFIGMERISSLKRFISHSLDSYAKEVLKKCLPRGGEFSGSDGWKEYEKYVTQNAKEFNIKLD